MRARARATRHSARSRSVCDDSIERDRWIANVRAASKRPMARYCCACANYAHVPPESSYAATGIVRNAAKRCFLFSSEGRRFACCLLQHRSLVGDDAGKTLFLVVARGHVFVYASAGQHGVDRASRVLRVLHLHGAPVTRIRRACWQVTTPHDAFAHQFEIVPDAANGPSRRACRRARARCA